MATTKRKMAKNARKERTGVAPPAPAEKYPKKNGTGRDGVIPRTKPPLRTGQSAKDGG